MDEDRFIGNIFSQYRVEELLGEGGMGVVYRAEHILLHEFAAIKFINHARAGDAESRRRFIGEAKHKVRHEHVVQTLHFGDDAGELYLVMELLHGEGLNRRLDRESKLAPAFALKTTKQIARGLTAIHDMDLIHRDLKPGNIFLEKHRDRFDAKILDLGLAKYQGGAASDSTSHSTIIGTPQYMSPEHIQGQVLGPASDLYSLAILFYKALCGSYPYNADSATAWIHSHIYETPIPFSQRDPVLGQRYELDAFFERCLDKDPKRRPVDSGAFLDALDAVFPDQRERPRRDDNTIPIVFDNQGSKIRAPVAVGLLAVVAVSAWALWPVTDPAVGELARPKTESNEANVVDLREPVPADEIQRTPPAVLPPELPRPEEVKRPKVEVPPLPPARTPGPPRVMVLMSEENRFVASTSPDAVGLGTAEATLLGELRSLGIECIDSGLSDEKLEREAALRGLDGDTEQAARLGLSQKADLVILGKAVAVDRGPVVVNGKSTQFVSSGGNVSFRLVATSNGRVLSAATARANEAHLDGITAGAKAIEGATFEAAETLLAEIESFAKRMDEGSSIELLITGLTSVRELEPIEQKLRDAGATVVYQRGYSGGIARLEVRVQADASWLAQAVEVIPFGAFRLSVTEVITDKVEARALR